VAVRHGVGLGFWQVLSGAEAGAATVLALPAGVALTLGFHGTQCESLQSWIPS